MYSTSREELMDYCLRALGHPVVEVNIDEEQLDDRIDEALQWFRENHPDGSKAILPKAPDHTDRHRQSVH